LSLASDGDVEEGENQERQERGNSAAFILSKQWIKLLSDVFHNQARQGSGAGVQTQTQTQKQTKMQRQGSLMREIEDNKLLYRRVK